MLLFQVVIINKINNKSNWTRIAMIIWIFYQPKDRYNKDITLLNPSLYGYLERNYKCHIIHQVTRTSQIETLSSLGA